MRIKKQLIINEDHVFLAVGLTKEDQQALINWLNSEDNQYSCNIGWADWTIPTIGTVYMLDCSDVRSGREAIVEYFEDINDCKIVYQESEIS